MIVGPRLDRLSPQDPFGPTRGFTSQKVSGYNGLAVCSSASMPELLPCAVCLSTGFTA